MAKRKYPDVMGIDSPKLDKFKYFKGFEDFKKAKAYAKKTKGQLYTQVDAGMERVYVKGSAIVNRTGRWMVVKT